MTRVSSEELRACLFQTDAEQYGDQFRNHLLEIYRQQVEMADRISARRQIANSFFASVNVATLGALSFFMGDNIDRGMVFVLLIGSILLNLVWWANIGTYRRINQAKFRVINEMEKELPAAPFLAEWKCLIGQKYKPVYLPFFALESSVPAILIGAALAVLLGPALIDWLG